MSTILNLFLSVFIILFILYIVKWRIRNQTNKKKQIRQNIKQQKIQNLKIFIDKSKQYYNKIQNEKQNMFIFYTIYKELLYIYTGSYFGTNINNVFSLIQQQKSQKQEQSIKNMIQTICFQRSSLVFLRNIIKNSQIKIIQTIQTFFSIIQSSQIQQVQIMNKFSIDLTLQKQQISSQIQFYKQNHNKIQKVDNQKQKEFQYQETNNLKKTIDLCNKIKKYIQIFKKIFQGNDVFSQYKKYPTITKQLKDKIYAILNKIFTINDKMNIKFKDQDNKIISLFKTIIEEEKAHYRSQSQYLVQENINLQKRLQKISKKVQNQQIKNSKIIQKCQQLQRQIKKSKNTINKMNQNYYIQDDQKQFSKTKINVFTADGENQMANFSQISNKKQIEDQGKQQITSSQYQLNKNTKLSFIKQLDKLMIRNRLRKQQQQFEQKMKSAQFYEQKQSID